MATGFRRNIWTIVNLNFISNISTGYKSLFVEVHGFNAVILSVKSASRFFVRAAKFYI